MNPTGALGACFFCGNDISNDSVVMWCSCLILQCRGCARGRLRKDGFLEGRITCPQCEMSTPVESILENREEIVKARSKLVMEAYQHYGLPTPNLDRITEDSFALIHSKFQNNINIPSELVESINKVLHDRDPASPSSRIRLDLVAAMEAIRGLKLSLCYSLELSSNIFIEKILVVVNDNPNSTYYPRLDRQCVVPLCGRMHINQCVLLTCKCSRTICLSCAYSIVANQPDTFVNGCLQCPWCFKQCRVVTNVDKAQKVENALIKSAYSRYKLKHEDDNDTDELKTLIKHFAANGVHGNMELGLIEKAYSTHYLRLKVARLEATVKYRQTHEGNEALLLGPLASLRFVKDKFREVFLHHEKSSPTDEPADKPANPFIEHQCAEDFMEYVREANIAVAHRYRQMYKEEPHSTQA